MFKIISEFFSSIFSKKSINITHDFSNRQMNLIVHSNHKVAQDKVIFNVSESEIIKTMKLLDWKEFQIVSLEKAEGEFLGVSGNLEDDGLSASWDEGGEMYIIKDAPESVQEMIDLLIRYLKGDHKLKELFE